MNTTSAAGPLLRVTFQGAAGTVTGSAHVVETPSRRFLLDCGLFQGRRAEARQRNSSFPFSPKDIDAVVLSHAHIDHCGKLPALIRGGFAGPIHCTPATRDLIAIMLADAAHIQEEDAAYLNRKRRSGEPKVEPLYDQRDVVRTLRACQSTPYDRPFDVGGGATVTFSEAGHLLGSAMVHLAYERGGRKASLSFTGDVGRKAIPILRDPAPLPAADLIISESTYGGRHHGPVEETADNLRDVVERTVARGGKVLIPAFSLGRTQTIVYFLHLLQRENRLPDVPIYVDSPLACSATEIFRLHPECFDEETLELMRADPDLFGDRRVTYVRDAAESRALNTRKTPAIIIAASGMCEAGRILHHLKHNIEDPKTTVMLVGYQGPDTLGRRIAERRDEVRVFDRTYRLRAEVVNLSGFSSHGDHDDLLATLTPHAHTAKAVRLVHGEPEAAAALAEALKAAGFADVAVPQPGDTVEV